ncbi:MAG: hypothetical protein KF915_07850 [Polyangiaceae bacterium]|nr:hypothetical protein [Polyangiaceae bacterium]
MSRARGWAPWGAWLVALSGVLGCSSGGAEGPGGGASGGSGGSGGVGGASGSAGSAATGGAAGNGGASGSAGSGGIAGSAGSGAVAGDGGLDAGEDVECPAAEKWCDGRCVPTDDPQFGCGAGCEPCAPGMNARCEAGACVLEGCAAGFGNCNLDRTDGCEVSLISDPANCGACGRACVVNHGVAACVAGECAVASCEVGFQDCDGDPSNGCEARIGADPSHCGGCGQACSATPGAQAVCRDGSCGEKACSAFRGDCNESSFDGCETNLVIDNDHCGFCGNRCELPNAIAKCDAARCVIESCVAPFADCDGDPGNGCEVDLSRGSALHCGACSRACSTAGVDTATCAGAECAHDCRAGFGDCVTPAFPAADDGCEQDLTNDPAHCGACALSCVIPGAVAGCAGGRCVVTSCAAGAGDCDGDPLNGCETDLQSDPAHCGACGRSCSASGAATTSCSAGLCRPVCVPGLGDCQTPAAPLPDDGCETPVASDPLNCGACGRRCSDSGVVGLSCQSGTCNSTCQPGLGNCINPVASLPDDGCETPVGDDSNHCGGCGNDCTLQGSPAGSLRCGAVTPGECGCVGNPGRCRVDSGTNPVCSPITGLCECGGVGCRPGEACVVGSSGDVCSCEGSAGCGPDELCCQSAGGCVDPRTSAAHCGGCSRPCPSGFACSASECGCTTDASCDAGSPGACSAGRCSCSGALCAPGQRCLGDGSCG